jgi:hypothetical protein
MKTLDTWTFCRSIWTWWAGKCKPNPKLGPTLWSLFLHDLRQFCVNKCRFSWKPTLRSFYA